MSGTVPYPCWNPASFGYWLLALTFLLALATGMARKSSLSPTLPGQNSYRSNQSDRAIESSRWRSEGTDYNSWREPPPPPSRSWRSKPRPSNPSETSPGDSKYFPEYQPGEPAFYNHRTGEQEDQIKVFEFGR